jgi:ribonuclease R
VKLVTIDDEDARDFDDAVFAEPDGDGHRLVVAIADVAWFVRPGDALDRAARERGNSVYFPDRVLPMLPERLSNDLCSLRPEEDRACLAAEIRVDARGRITSARFTRALMRSAARLTYAKVEAAHRGEGRRGLVPGDAGAIDRLYAAFATLDRDRERRGALDLDLEERQVMLDDSGAVTGVRARPRYSSHRLIEAFMIAANVAAARALTDQRIATLFRVHDEPERDRLEALRETLAHLGYRLAKGQVVRPAEFNRILAWANGRPFRHLVHTMVLRTQSMAVYHAANRGHFGLGLARYLHFTSPIRRYADLVVHRALVTRFALGEGGHARADPTDWAELARHVSDTERRAAAAERQAVDLFLARFLADKRGAEFSARVSGVTRFGVFVTLDGLGADGLIPMSRLPAERYVVDDRRHRLLTARGRVVLTLGDRLEVRLAKIDLARGRLAFEWLPDRVDPPRGRQEN